MSFAYPSLLCILAVSATTLSPASVTDARVALLQNPVVQGPVKKPGADDSTLVPPPRNGTAASTPTAAPTATVAPHAPTSTPVGTARAYPGRGIFGGGRPPVIQPVLPEPISQYIP